MKKFKIILCLTAICVVSNVYARSFIETFDANSLGWTECAVESNYGTAIIDKGVMTVTSKGENKGLGALLTGLSGIPTQVGMNTFFETHCYAPINVNEPFEVKVNVIIDKLARDRICGLMFNYKDGGNFYAFVFNEEMITFVRYENNVLVGSIDQGIKWQNKKKLNQQWRLVSEGDMLSFYVDDMEIMKVRYMPLDYAGLGFYTFGKQKLIVDDIEFIQM